MQCPKCQFDNPEDSNFCLECGQKLEQICPQCEKTLPVAAKFCNGCGQKLTAQSTSPQKEISFDEKLDKIQRYLPKGLTEKILAQRDRIEGERKQVTVMFCDMAGFTALSEKLGIEEAYAIMDQIYEILIHKVHDYEGTVNEMTGDGIMALFGAPIALEDASQRAIRSALAIHRELTKFNDMKKQDQVSVPPIRMRIGIHTGPVVVGTLGNDLRVEFKAVGDTVNLASRVENLAEPGTTWVTDDTFKLAEGLFRFESLGERNIKGKEKPVRIYRVITPSTRRTRFDVSAERGLTPFVGRERELELLLDGFERVKSGRGQAISIMAEAGVGKSRLLYEFRKVVVNEDATFLEGKCLSYSRGVAYHPLIDILKANFDLLETDGSPEIREKINRGLKILGLDETLIAPYFLELLSVKDSGIDQISISPEAKQDRIIEAFKQIVLKISEIRPLILVYEDLHWVDKSSETVLKYVLKSIPGARILMLFTYRPEYVHTWGGRSFHNQITLNRLSNRESLVMISHLLGTTEIESDLEELVLEKAEGIPFFIEEFMKSLIQLKVIEKKNNRYHLAKDFQDVAVPSTIQDVIMARIDSLPEGAKEVLQTGSVIEREFSHPLIQRVTGLSEQELLSNLSALKDSELLYERGIYPELSYIFKHALTREVIYDSILTKRKRNFHAKVAYAIEDIYSENVSEHYGVLVEHFSKSEIYEKAAEYSKLASRKAIKTGSMNDAILYTKMTIFSLEKLPTTGGVQKFLIDARTKLGLNLLDMNYFHEAIEAIEPIIDVALRTNYKKRIPQIYAIVATGKFCIEENFHEAFNYFEKALRVSNGIRDVGSLIYANYWMGYARSVNCEFESAIHYLKESLDLHIKLNNLPWIAVIKATTSILVYQFKGNIQMAFKLSSEAVLISKETNDINSKLFAYSCHGISLFGKGRLIEARNFLMQGLEFNEKINQLWWNLAGNQYLGDINFCLGEYQRAINHYLKVIQLLETKSVYHSWLNLSKIALARSKAASKEEHIDMGWLYACASENKFKILDGWGKRYVAETLLYLDGEHLSEAEQWIKQSIEVDKKRGMMIHLGQDYATYAAILKRQSHKTQAREYLGEAIKIFKDCGADGWVGKYEKELDNFLSPL
jgi:class 3 adenylate cyclase/tetratricopeptide (TPR) repeat protein